MSEKSVHNLSKPIFERSRNVFYAKRRKLKYGLLGQLFEIRANTRPDFPIMTFENGSHPDVIQTFQDLHENSHRFARALMDAGIGKGDKYSVLMYNYPEMIHLMAAASILGAIIVVIDPRSKGHKLAHQISDSKSKAVFVTADLLDHIEAIKDKIPEVKRIYAIEKPGFNPTGDISKCASIQEINEAPFRPVDYQISDTKSPFQIIYTSGTTGDPKGVLQENGRLAIYGYLLSKLWNYKNDDVLYTGLSLTHGNAIGCTLTPSLYRCIKSVFSVKFTKSRLWDITRKYGVTSFSMLGGVASGIFNEAPRPDDKDNPVRQVVSAGMPRAIWADFEKRFDLNILEWYSTLEGGGFASKKPGKGPIGSFGKPAFFFKMKIVDENGNECPPNVPGEIIARPIGSKDAEVNYFNNPEASETKTRGGWNRTGDIAHKDENGWYFFDYRMGGGLRRQGDFIQPDLVERVIGEHPDVSEVSIFGIPAVSGAPGESDLVAAIALFKGKEVDPAGIFECARKGLEANSVPSYLLYVDEIPKTISEKPQERFLKEKFEENLEQVYKQEDYRVKK
ncbi:MAG: AMP-binding protein [Desulfobacterales bacterium]|nr:AMP-binding protein [Desulfobacterales bacterium]